MLFRTAFARPFHRIFSLSYPRIRPFAMRVLTIPALSDNYMYLLVDEKTNQCAAVDPVEPKKLLSKVEKNDLILACVLTTHHHWDHAGGNNELLNLISTPVRVYGGGSSIEAVTNQVSHGETINLGKDITITCLHTPCHTKDHICYYATTSDQSDGCVFTGDTLFLGGCGRFFEGTAEQMYHALIEILGKLPGSTKVYCGHEYTVKNFEFAKTVDSENKALLERMDVITKMRKDGKFTVPGTMREELDTNPFMRVTDPGLQSRVQAIDAIDAMRVVRQMKDRF
nr:hydroxyacylglutathione hydrolase [Hymenolepis microstoma]